MPANDLSGQYDPNAPQYTLPQIDTPYAPPANPGNGSNGRGFQPTDYTWGSQGSKPAAVASGTVPGNAYPGSYAPQSSQYATLAPGQGTPNDVGFNGNVPGMGENVSAAFLNHYGSAGTPGVSNNAQAAYSNFSANAGNAPAADMSAYYDNASRLNANAINTQMAARGSYGSSNAIGQLGNAETNLRAQQARDEAQYGLQRAQYGLSRAGAEGSLASSADASSRGASAEERDWMSGLSDLGFKNQRESTARYELGNEDARTAAGISSGIQGDVYGKELDQQQSLLVQQLMATNGWTADQATAAANGMNQQRTDNNQTTGTMVEGAKALAGYV